MPRYHWPVCLHTLTAIQVVVLITSRSYDEDPILAQQPNFARSLPVQILMTGIIFALVAVLLVHLIFTAQYHWPLAPINYVLQVSSVLVMFISLIATILVVLAAARSDSQGWPYMLTYIAVVIPPLDDSSGLSVWGIGEQTAWCLMDATTSLLVQVRFCCSSFLGLILVYPRLLTFSF